MQASEDVDDNAAAKASSKDEEFLAICELRGVGADAPLARQLKAVEAEYHALKEQKNQQKAEHVQALYSWKSSQVAKVYLHLLQSVIAETVAWPSC